MTIGIPTFNRAVQLKTAVASCRAQTYTELEIVISDNASTDDTEALCETWSRIDDRIHVITQPRNIGREANFAAVLQAATGTFFMWLSDDDWLDPDYVRSCADRLTADPRCALVGGRALYHTRSGELRHETALSLLSPAAARRIESYLAAVTWNGTYYGLMRRADVHRAGYPITLSGDWYFVAQMAALGTVVQLAHVVVHRSAGGDSTDMHGLAVGYGVSAHWGKDIHLWALGLVVPSLVSGQGTFALIPRRQRLVGSVRVAGVLVLRWWSYAGRDRLRQLARTGRALLRKRSRA